MRLAFRWFGAGDPIPLRNIRQIPGVESVVSALYDVPVGEAWPVERVEQLKVDVEDAGLRLDVIESIPVHEDIKLGRPERTRWTEQYCASISALGAAGIPVLCYNFMPVFDWVRTDLNMRLPDGSTALAYDDAQLAAIDLRNGTRDLPGWAASYSGDELAALTNAYRDVDDEKLWDNLAWFIEQIVPAAEAANVKLAIHPDDPPWSVFGLPRILTSGAALTRFIELNDSPVHGVTFCTGSLAPTSAQELPKYAAELAARGRIHFAHCRNVKITGPRSFHEVAHPAANGDVDMPAVLRALHAHGFTGPMRPDHGRRIWGEEGRPGYGLYDRALGAVYLKGVWEALEANA
ncbi:MAG TPA: mannonate dehydratase [Longimicrobiales bacterium]